MRIEIEWGSENRGPRLYRLILLVLPFVLAGFVLWKWSEPLLATFSPFAVAFIFAYLLNPIIDRMVGEKRRYFRMNRALAISVLFLGLALFVLGIIAYVVPNIVRETTVFTTHFRQNLFPALKEEIQPVLDRWFARQNILKNPEFREWSKAGIPVGWELTHRGTVRPASKETGGAVLHATEEGALIRQTLAAVVPSETYTLEVLTTGSLDNRKTPWRALLWVEVETGDGIPFPIMELALRPGEIQTELVRMPEDVRTAFLAVSCVGRGPYPELEIVSLELLGPPALPIFDLTYWSRWYEANREHFTWTSLGRVLTYGFRGAGMVAGGAGGVWSWISNTLGGAASFLVYLSLLVVIAFYMLLDFAAFKKSCVDLVPEPFRDRFVIVMRNIDRSLGGFIRGQATICFFVGVMVMGFMLLLRVPFAVLIGMAAGAFNFIPYLGPAMGMVPAVVLTLLDFLEPGADFHWLVIKLGLVLGSFMVVQAIDGFFLSPKILSESVDVPPLVVMAALMLGGGIAGVTGMVLAIPVYCILRVLAAEYRAELSRTFGG